MSKPVKLGLVIVLFMVGSGLVINSFASINTLWLMLPGIILLLIAYPWAHVLWAEWHSNYRHKRDEAILAEAEAEMRKKRG